MRAEGHKGIVRRLAALPGRAPAKGLWLLLALLLGACSQDAARRFGEAVFADHSPPKFVQNAVRPIFTCGEAPDPLYPCQGMGPEGFVRDLVARPLFNPRQLNINDLDRGKAFSLRWNWFSMQGGCRYRIDRTNYLSQGTFMSVPSHEGGRPFLVGLTKRSAELLSQHRPASSSPKPVWPPQPICEADNLDMAAGRPFSAALWIWKPEPEESPKLFARPTTPSPANRFDTGCHWEKRNDIKWQVCRTSMMLLNRSGEGSRENLVERWQAVFGDTGLHIQIVGYFSELLLGWPQWYAERRAALHEVVDSVRLESLPPPPAAAKTAFPGWMDDIEQQNQENLRRIEEYQARSRAQGE